jgi:plasmid stabilization system protein ParE
MKHTFHPHARKELQEAIAYCDKIDPDLGDSFLREITECVSRILSFPEAWTQIPGGARRCRTNRFPYGLIYREEDDHIFFLAVMHLHRKPNYWADRE